MDRHFLNNFFDPQSIAVVGASDKAGSLGQRVMSNLLAKPYQGQLYPVSDHPRKLFGQKTYRSLKDIEQAVDLVIITSELETVSEVLMTCAEVGVDSVVLLTPMHQIPGSREAYFHEQLETICRNKSIKLIGPNGFGIVNANLGSKATYHSADIVPGKIALVSQSGAICSAVVDWAQNHGVGFSHVICLEQCYGLDLGDVLIYLLTDMHTDSILIYLEGVHDARHFVSGLRAAARGKPVIVLKAGRHIGHADQLMLHTGALVGDDEVFDAALDRAGAVRVMAINDLFLGARAFLIHRKVRGDRIAVISNANAPNVMASDVAFDLNMQLAELSPGTQNEMNQVLRCPVSTRNPVQLSADAGSECFSKAVKRVLEDAQVDMLLVVFTPQHNASSLVTAQQVIEATKSSHKPVIACWMGDAQVMEGRKLFQQAGIPCFATPENAMKAAHFLLVHYHNRKLLLQTPEPPLQKQGADKDGARLIIEGVLQEGRKTLSQLEAKAVLNAFRIPVSTGVVAHTPNEALVAAETVGFPVVLKINSPDISHKTDVEGVVLGVQDASSVRSAFNRLLEQVRKNLPQAQIDGVIVEPMIKSHHQRELLAGFKRDAVFGPVIVFGAGGSLVELIRDYAVALPPLNEYLARNLIEKTKISALLGAYRNMDAVDIKPLSELLVRISDMACELPWIQSLEINPLLIDEQGMWAVDVRAVIDYIPVAQERYAHIAIHPYPSYLISHYQLKDGTDIEIRPIRPEDAELEKEFIENLSPQSRYYRFMHTLKQVSPEMLVRFTQIDYHRELALVAIVRKEGRLIEIGVSRYALNIDGNSCEFAVVVSDQWQHLGIGYILMEKLIEAARLKNISRMEGVILRDNQPMQRLARSLGFTITPHESDDEVVLAVKTL